MDKLDKNCDQVGQNYDQFGPSIRPFYSYFIYIYLHAEYLFYP